MSWPEKNAGSSRSTALRWRKPRAELGRKRGRIWILRRLVGIQLVRHSDGGRETVRERSGRRELREQVKRSLAAARRNSAKSLCGIRAEIFIIIAQAAARAAGQ